MSDIPESDRLADAPHPRHTYALYGQDQAEAAFLESYASNRLHHAWLITGPQGVGKATLAWRIARYLLAEPAKDDMFAAPLPTDSLSIADDHPIARRLKSLGEPRLHLTRRAWDDKTKRLKTAISVEDIRALKSFFTLSATDGGWRVAIIDAADDMTQAAANAVLKILEEPPEKTLFLLVCHQPARLLPTIRSRCRTLKCDPLSNEVLTQAMLSAGIDLPRDIPALHALSGGSVGEAIRLYTDGGLDTYERIIALAGTLPRLDRPQATTLAESCAGRGNEAQYDMVLHLMALFLNRLARFGVLQPATMTEAAASEARLFARLAPNPAKGRDWANLAQELSARSEHARAVNLDPASVILDMWLKIDKAAS